MEQLNFPAYHFNITGSESDRLMIYDIFRKKKVRLTPEEWVRQNVLCFLAEEKKVPRALIISEAGIIVNRLKKRYDALIYRNANPWMLVECKAPNIPISQDTFDQVLIYNNSINARYILVTNGIKHYCCYLDRMTEKFVFLNDLPFFDESKP